MSLLMLIQTIGLSMAGTLGMSYMLVRLYVRMTGKLPSFSTILSLVNTLAGTGTLIMSMMIFAVGATASMGPEFISIPDEKSLHLAPWGGVGFGASMVLFFVAWVAYDPTEQKGQAPNGQQLKVAKEPDHFDGL